MRKLVIILLAAIALTATFAPTAGAWHWHYDFKPVTGTMPAPAPFPAVFQTGLKGGGAWACYDATYPECDRGAGVYVNSGSDRTDYIHELGHFFDYSLPEGLPFRDRFRALIKDDRPWRAAPNSPHEQFAEAYALCALRSPARVTRRWLRWQSGGYTYTPTLREHRQACALIRQAQG